MSTVLLDVSASTQQWFQDALKEMGDTKHKHVKFLYTEQEKYKTEISKVLYLAKFLKLMGDKGRRVDVDKDACKAVMDELEANATWIGSSACDDPHIFAMVALKSARYIFTDEHRISKCRKCMSHVKNSMCAFKAIRSGKIYKKHRNRILRP
ncbi:hypothetical protein N2601_05725 [Rhizobium sp. CB3060]|uniref:hypothetical protein n=1 Tax=Rhizobium sp. CB3060 TaxID=3138255 RepID=UPI0021A736D7|nr:hypothetical protein [Rhizobium tropici]UWU22463.1 hypothetical protein N2601_05725 [Rhizobium tropici]